MKSNTQGGRLLRVLVRAYPRAEHDGYVGGPDEFANDFYTARNRVGDTLKPRGFLTVSRKREGHLWWEYRLANAVVYMEAYLLVLSWDSGLTVAQLQTRGTVIPLPPRDVHPALLDGTTMQGTLFEGSGLQS
jgi:hypothetical protein